MLVKGATALLLEVSEKHINPLESTTQTRAHIPQICFLHESLKLFLVCGNLIDSKLQLWNPLDKFQDLYSNATQTDVGEL